MREHQDLDVAHGGVGGVEAFKTGLEGLHGLAWHLRGEAEDGACIAELQRLGAIGLARQVDACGGDRQVGAQAKLGPVGAGEDAGLAAQLLAHPIEEGVGWLHDGGINALGAEGRELGKQQ